ncbi:MAG: ABC transporter permease [Bacillota bacterium]
MLIYIIRRLLMVIPILIVVSLLTFLLIYLVPGDPAIIMAGMQAPDYVVNQIRDEMGLNRPFLDRMVDWYKELFFKGNLGYSYFLRRSVTDAILERLPVTLTLAGLSTLFAMLLGIPLGVLAALKQNKLVDQLVSILALLGLSVPGFWLGLLLIMFFAVGLGWFPPGGYVPLTKDFLGGLRSIALPVFSLGFIITAQIARMTRSSMIDVMRNDYIRTARAKGVKEIWVTFRHALKNSIIPVLTVIGTLFGVLMGGTVTTEIVFTLPGIGRLAAESILKRDYPVIQGLLLTIAFVFVIVNLIVDILYAYFDPRIRYD